MLNEDRLIDIETKLAHQEHLLSELDDALTDQQGRISRLETLCQTLVDRVQSLAAGAPTDESSPERPPHY